MIIVARAVVLPGLCAVMTNTSWRLFVSTAGGMALDTTNVTEFPTRTGLNHCEFSEKL